MENFVRKSVLEMRSVTLLGLLFGQFLLLHLFVVVEESLLDLGALHIEFVEVKLVLVGFNLLSTFATTASTGDIALTTITGLVGVSETRLGSQTDIAESVFFIVKFRVLIVEVVTSSGSFSGVLFVLSDLAEFVGGTVGHSVEDFDNILRLLLEDGVFGKSSELVVDALSPVANLVVDDVNALESITKLREDLHHFSIFGLHGDDLLVGLSTLSRGTGAGSGIGIN